MEDPNQSSSPDVEEPSAPVSASGACASELAPEGAAVQAAEHYAALLQKHVNEGHAESANAAAQALSGLAAATAGAGFHGLPYAHLLDPATAAAAAHTASENATSENDASAAHAAASAHAVASAHAASTASKSPGEGAARNGRWSADEHKIFLRGVATHGRTWTKVALMIGTRTASQVRSHAQKFDLRLSKELATIESEGRTVDSENNEELAAAVVSQKHKPNTGKKRGGGRPKGSTKDKIKESKEAALGQGQLGPGSHMPYVGYHPGFQGAPMPMSGEYSEATEASILYAQVKATEQGGGVTLVNL